MSTIPDNILAVGSRFVHVEHNWTFKEQWFKEQWIFADGISLTCRAQASISETSEQ